MEKGVSGYFDIPGTEHFTGRFFYSEEYDKTTGKRVVSITGISIQSTVYGGTWYPGGTVKVEGETLCTMSYEGKTTHMVSVGASEKWHEVAAIDMWGLYFPWESGEIGSNPDGGRTVTFDVDITLWRNSSSPKMTIKGSHTVELTKIQLASQVAPAASGAAMGSTLLISIDRAESSYTHILKYSFGGGSGVIAEGVGASAQWQIPLELAKLIPHAVSGVATIICETYNGETLMGQTSAEVTLTVPDNESTKPTAQITVIPESALAEAFAGLFIQGQTRLRVAVTAESEYSEVGNVSISAEGATEEGAEATFSPPARSGAVTVKATVTDTRGYTASITTEITVIPYDSPKVIPYTGESKVVCIRCDDTGAAKTDGTNLLVRAGRSYSKIIADGQQKNHCTLKYRYKLASGAEYGDWQELLSAEAVDTDMVNTVITGGLFGSRNEYMIQIAAADEITDAEKGVTLRVASAGVPLHLGEGGRNAGIGQYCDYSESDRVDVGWKTWFNGGVGLRSIFEAEDGWAEGDSLTAAIPEASILAAANHTVFLAVAGGCAMLCVRVGELIRGSGAAIGDEVVHYCIDISCTDGDMTLNKARSVSNGSGTTTAITVNALYAIL